MDELLQGSLSVKVPTRNDKIYKSECMFSFDSPVSSLIYLVWYESFYEAFSVCNSVLVLFLNRSLNHLLRGFFLLNKCLEINFILFYIA